MSTKLKIYYAASIRGGRNHIFDSIEIAKIIEKNNCLILDKHVFDSKLKKTGETNLKPNYIFTRDIAWLKKADCVIAEVTNPSLGVGYEICYALEKLKIPVLSLNNQKKNNRLSFLIDANPSKLLKVYHYKNIKKLEPIITKFLTGVKNGKN